MYFKKNIPTDHIGMNIASYIWCGVEHNAF